jgi:hypothetical protein
MSVPATGSHVMTPDTGADWNDHHRHLPRLRLSEVRSRPMCALTESGCEVIISPAKGVADFHGIGAVIVAGSLYANRWNRDARRFFRRNTATLRILPAWVISQRAPG